MRELIRDILKDEYPNSKIEDVLWELHYNEPRIIVFFDDGHHPTNISLTCILGHIYKVAKNA